MYADLAKALQTSLQASSRSTRRDGAPYIVLGYGYWQRRFGGDASVLNRVIDMNGHPMTVIGVAQKGFRGIEPLSPTDLFVPMMMKEANSASSPILFVAGQRGAVCAEPL